MTIHLRCSIMAGFIAGALTIASSLEIGQAAVGDAIQVPPVPQDIQVEPGNTVSLVGHAAGTQDYICLPSSSGFSWTFFAPQATLFQNIKWFNGDIRLQTMTHFLSPNPEENGLPRATWQHSLDTSAVWAKLFKFSSDANFVAPGAIPWFLLQRVGSQRGPTGAQFSRGLLSSSV
jgi:hypothetical protein